MTDPASTTQGVVSAGNHTAGPWTLDAQASGWALLAQERDVAFFDASEEDARLIAAAPDLLVVLQLIAEDVSDNHDCPMCDWSYDEGHDVGCLLPSVIRKALGT